MTALLLLLTLAAGQTAPATRQAAPSRHAVTGLVLDVDAAHAAFVASIDRIPGFMEAMTMPFHVRDGRELTGVVPGTMVDFTLVVDGQSSYVESLHIRHFQSTLQDPLAARRLSLFQSIASGRAAKMLAVGAAVPDFTLIDQKSRPVTLSAFRGKVVALNFMYTTCQLPDFCLRIVNHFGALRKRFDARLGSDLIFLTMTFDPVRDQPDVLDRYAAQWTPNPASWHFLTGPVPDVQRVLELFGVSAFPNEGLMDHSLHTVLIDRKGRLAANIEGNQYSSDQLGDLIQALVEKPSTPAPRK
jgi:protein SCO1/2